MAANNAEGTQTRSLPPGWRWVRLGEVCIINPRRPEMRRPDGALTTFIPMSAVEEDGRGIARPVQRPFAEVRKGYTYFAEGDVLFAEITPCMQNAKHAIAQDLIDGFGFGSTEFHVIRPNDTVAAEWILHFILQPRVLQEATKHFTGAVGQQRVPEDYLRELEIPLPPLSEQKRIAAILNEQMAAVERARAAAQAQLQAARALPAAYLRQIFPKPGQKLPAGWRWVRLGEVCEADTGTRDPRRKPDERFRYVDIAGVDNRSKAIAEARTLKGVEAPSRARQVIRAGDVIVATTRPNLNAVALVPHELDNQICSTGFCVLRSKPDLAPDYLFAFVQTTDFVQSLSDLVKGALYPAVTDKQVRTQFIPLPPLSEQKRIAAILNEQMAAVERARAAAQAQMDTINRLPSSLLRRAFNGEL